MTIGLAALPGGGTRIIVGGAAQTSRQLKPAVAEKSDKPGIQAADYKLPANAADVKYDIDQKRIEFSVPGAKPPKLGEEFAAQMESLGWTRERFGSMSDAYTFITFTKDKAEVQLRARTAGNKASAMISGDGLRWDKALPTAPVRISYETWMARNGKNPSLAHLDEFAAQMRKIPASRKAK
jgi:hypothetical protein